MTNDYPPPKRKPWPRLYIANRLTRWLALALAYSLVVKLTVDRLALPDWPAGQAIDAVLGIAFSAVVVLRLNAANDRWWEARKLWGQLTNDLRNLALKVKAHVAIDADDRRQFAQLLVGFPNALRLYLRGSSEVRGVPGFEKDLSGFPHAPGYMAGLIHDTLNRWNRDGRLKDTIWILDVHARGLMDVAGACERIRNTPLASSYRALLLWGIIFLVLFSPWSMAPLLGWWILPMLMIAFGFLLGLEFIAEVIEEPFGVQGDDLPLETYCQNIESFVIATLDSAGSS